MKKIIVIGSGAAGAKAASKCKSLNPQNQIDLYTNIDIIAYSLCGLPYFIEGIIPDINKLILRTPKDFEDKGINVYLNSVLEQIIPEENCVIIDGNHIFYDELILATGAEPFIPNIKNINAKEVFTLRNTKSAIAIKEKMLKSKSVVIIGGGYIALELLEAFIKNDLKVTIIESQERLAKDFDKDFSKIIKDIIKNQTKENCEIILSDSADEIITDENNQFKGVITKRGKKLYSDFCVLSCGIKPNVEIARNAGIKLGQTGTIAVDNKMRTNFKNIYACGDCCEKYCIITKQAEFIGLGTIANKEGRVAAINATSNIEAETFDGILGSIITKFFDYSISKTGLTYQKAIELSNIINIEPIEVTITKKDKAGYMPDSNNLTLKLVADKRSKEILGAQAIGYIGNVAQRINTITSILKSRKKIDDILHLDLPYAPPFSGSVDPILTAAYKLKEISQK